jgi:hypothetical protein
LPPFAGRLDFELGAVLKTAFLSAGSILLPCPLVSVIFLCYWLLSFTLDGIIPIPNKNALIFYLELEGATGCRGEMRSISEAR